MEEDRPKEQYCQRDQKEQRSKVPERKVGKTETAMALAQNILRGGRPPKERKQKIRLR